MRRLGASVMAALLAAGSFVLPMESASPAHAAAPPPFVAPAGGTISGQVTDDRGAPLSGVSVQILGGAWSRSVATAADGRYVATSLTDGSYRVSVNDGSSNSVNYNSYVPYPELINVTATTGQTGVDFEIPRPAIVTGTVRNEAGTAVGNAAVVGLNGYMPVAPDGQYLGTTTAGPHTVSVGAPGYVGWSFSPGAFSTQTVVTGSAGQRTSLDLTLDSGGSISGLLVDANGVPAVNATVSAAQINPVGIGSYGSTATDPAGHYEIKALLAGTYSVSATSASTSAAGAVYYPGTPDWRAAAPVTVLDGAVTPSIDFALPAPVPLGPPITATSMSPVIFYRGTTTTATINGTGFVAGSNLHVDRWGPGNPPEISVVQVIDSEHVLVSVAVPPDAELYNEGGIYVTQSGQFAELQGVPFIADAGSSFGTISGRITRASDGTSVSNVRVTAESISGSASFYSSTFSLADGTYVLGPLQPGDYAVRFSPNWGSPDLASEFYPDAKTDLTKAAVTVVGDADTPNIDAVLEPSTTALVTAATPSVLQPGSTTDVVLTGTGFDIDDGINVSSQSYESWAPRIVSQQVVSSTEVHARIEVGAMSPSMQVTVNAPPHGSGFVNQCFCMSVATTAQSTGMIVGSIADPIGDGLRSIRVSATLAGQSAPTTTVWTGQDGTYALRLPAGTYAIHGEDLAGATADVSATSVGVGETVPVATTTLIPLAAIGTLSGTVTDASIGLVLDGALVEATNVTTHEATAVVSHGGTYQFPTLPAGDYLLEFEHPGYTPRWYNGVASAAAATTVTVVADGATTSVNQALTVSRRPLSVSSLQPNRVALGESVANVVITGAGFLFDGVTNLSFSAGDGVSITDVSVVGDTSAMVSVIVAPNAAIGLHDLVATRDDGQQATCTGCLRVFAALGSIGGTVALAGGGSNMVNVSVVSTTTGETFRAVASPGSWLIDRLPADTYSVGFSSFGFVDQWYDHSDTSAAATPVVVGAGPVGGVDAVMAAARKYLSVWSLSPFALQQGSQTSVTITGQGFLDGGVTGFTIDAGPGTTVQGISVVSDSTATATLTVAADAPLGFHLVKVSRDDATTSTCFSCLQVIPAPAHVSGRVTGTNGLAYGWVDAYRVGDQNPSTVLVQPDGTYSFDLQPGDYQLRFNGYSSTFGITYTTEWWNDASSQATATTITVAAGQTVSGIDAQLSVPSSPLSLTQYFAPYEAWQGTSHSVSLIGSGFLNGVTGLAFSAGTGIGVTVDSVTSDTVANVTITADPGAALGLRDITVSRGDGQTATCTLCLNVVTPPPGNVVAYSVLDADTGGSVYGSATISAVGDPTPVWSGFVSGSVYAYGLAAGDYDLTIVAAGYTPFTTPVTVLAGQTTYLPVLSMQTIRQPLTYTGPAALAVYQGYPAQFFVTGSGFRSGGVTGLSFSAGADVTIDGAYIVSDNGVWITVTASPTAQTGSRDLTVTRDDGQTATCTACLVISAPAPGTLSITVVSSDTYNYLPATVTITPVGGSTPIVVSVDGPYSLSDLQPGQYDVLFESVGYESTTQQVTILPGQTTYVTPYLVLPRQPLTITSVTPSTIYQGAYYASIQVVGSGFRAGGVTGVTASLGPDASIIYVYASTDSSMQIYYSLPPDAAIGPRDVTIGRDPAETATCTGCVTVAEAPGYLSGYINDVDCCPYFTATITATRVGDLLPTVSTVGSGYYSLQLAPGEYIVKVEADGYLTQWWNASSTEAGATSVSVAANTFTSADFQMVATRRPLTITGLSWPDFYQGQTTYIWAYGSGFLTGGVTGLMFSSSNDVAVELSAVFSDTEALLTVTPGVTAALGPRNLSVTRDDGQTATCTACLTVRREYPMVFSVSPSVVREGTRTLKVDGQFLQRVIRVTTSPRKVKVKSFTNNADGTVSVRLVIDGGARRTYTLTLIRDDGQTVTVDFSVRG